MAFFLALGLVGCSVRRDGTDVMADLYGSSEREVVVSGERDYARYGIPPNLDMKPKGWSTSTHEGDGSSGRREVMVKRTPIRDEKLVGADDPDWEGGKYPVAKRGEMAGQVVSPYPPHRTIDVGGFKSGELAKDPASGEIFEVP